MLPLARLALQRVGRCRTQSTRPHPTLPESGRGLEPIHPWLPSVGNPGQNRSDKQARFSARESERASRTTWRQPHCNCPATNTVRDTSSQSGESSGSSFAHVVALETSHSAVKTVLVIDDDLGFLFWIGKTLEHAEYNVIPAVSTAKAHSLLSALALAPDLLIINPVLPDSADFIDILRRDSPGLRVMAAVDEDTRETTRIDVEVDRWVQKPPGLIIAEGAFLDQNSDTERDDQASREEWLLILRMALEGNSTSAD